MTSEDAPGYNELTWSWLTVWLVAVAIVAVASGARLLVNHRRRTSTADLGSSHSARTSSITGERSIALWPVAALLIVLTFAILLASERGWFVADNLFVWYWNPSRALALLATAWNGQANLGGPAGLQGQLFVLGLGLLRLLGFDPWLAQRISLAALLAGGAVGAAYLTREFTPRSRIAPLVAGLWWLAAPYSLAFLIPSSLYIHAALSPFMVLALLKGVTTPSRWRWAAIFALLVALSGWTNPPALAFAAVPMVPTVAYVLLTGRSTVRVVVRWVASAGLLVALIVLPSLVRSLLSAGNLASNLSVSESAQAVSQSSSWAESLRGLGFWLSYWNPTGRLVQPYVTSLLNEPVAIVLSFVPLLVAMVVVGFTKVRGRLLLGVVLLLAAAAMVGGYPASAPSPYGNILFTLFRDFPVTFALRNSYKAGAGLLLATAVLFGMGVLWMVSRDGRRWGLRTVAVGSVAAIVAVCGQPLWSGALFQGANGNNGVPQYWYDATSWLDQQPGSGRALIVPAADTPTYRWGSAPNGDLFASLLARPFVLSQVLTNATPDAANLIRALSNDLASGDYQQGAVGPIARRLGISYVVIRNDLNWQRLGLVRPSRLNSLRADPELVSVASFGSPGENVTSTQFNDPADSEDLRLTPVEIFRVTGATEPVRAVSAAPSLLLSGDGAAWTGLARDGVLSRSGPVRYSARQTSDELVDELQRGAAVTVTDTNRRSRLGFSTAAGATVTEQVTDRVGDLFAQPGSQSVVTFPDAVAISQVGAPDLVGAGPAHQPVAAFTGDSGSSWLTGGLLPLADQGLRVKLTEARQISSISMRPAEGPGTRRVTSVRVEFPDGTNEAFALGPERTSVSFRTRTVDEFTIRVTGLLGVNPGYFGLSEVAVPGVDLDPIVQLPDDVIRTAVTTDAGRDALAVAPLSYRFQRLGANGEEPAMRRSFRVSGTRSADGLGTLSLSPRASDAVFSRLLGTAAVATSSSRYRDLVSSSGALAVDGDVESAWALDGETGGFLTVRFPTRRVTSVDVTVDASPTTSAPSSITATVGDVTVTAGVPVDPSCPVDAICTVTVGLQVPATITDSVVVQVEPEPLTPTASILGAPPIRIAEVGTNGVSNPAVNETLPATCQRDLLSMDGVDVGIQLRGATKDDLVTGRPVPVVLCSEVVLGDGWHNLLSSVEAPLDEFVLVANDGSAPRAAAAVPVVVEELGNTSVGLSLDSSPGVHVIIGQGFSANWGASTENGGLGRPVELDTQTAWVLDGSGPTTMTASYLPERGYTALMWFSVLMLAAAVALAVADPRSRIARAAPWAERQPLWRLPLDLATVGFALLVGGLVPGLMALAFVVVLRRGWVRPPVVAVTALALMVGAVLLSVPPLGPALAPLDPSWVMNRAGAHELARLAAVTFMVVIDAGTMRWVQRPPRSDAPEPDPAVPATLSEGESSEPA